MHLMSIMERAFPTPSRYILLSLLILQPEDVIMQPNFEQLPHTIQHIVEQTDFSGAVAIKTNGTVVFEQAYGLADRSHHIPNTIETRFNLASGAKFLTALGIGRLIESGQISLSTPLTTCLDIGFPNISQEVTIGQLTTHTSGVYDYLDEEVISDIEQFVLPIPCYRLRRLSDYVPLLQQGPMKFPPGERFSYSNSGYILLGLVIEAISGQAYADFMQREILDRCGMNDSGYFAMDRLPERTATGYIADREGWRSNIYHLPVVGAADGGVYSTIGDLHKLWDAFFADCLISRDLRHTFLSPAVHAASQGPHTFYGHGIWMHREPDSIPEYYMMGIDAGVSFMSKWSHSGERMVTVMSNTSHGAMPVRRAIDQLLW
jgi:CubicO group peptidase (beta-lactamase class C family)